MLFCQLDNLLTKSCLFDGVYFKKKVLFPIQCCGAGVGAGAGGEKSSLMYLVLLSRSQPEPIFLAGAGAECL